MEEKMRPIVNLIDDLRRLGIEKDIEIPHIVVLGDQSSGKSSVLEAISGINLRRGPGLLTRCPIELRMKRSTHADKPWRANIRLSCRDSDLSCFEGEIQNKEEIGKRISRLTEILIRNHGKPSVLEPGNSIIVDVESPDVPNLTVIDVPGVVKTCVNGENELLGMQGNGLIDHYLKKQRSLIVAVIPSNVSHALHTLYSFSSS